ncbi:hypothetical protein FBR05_10025 [Deltaproteobacteria bacterium PRO3]|nr:hypothetical protein [Deltaproteobacteria bacterium PRO3]
MAPPTADRPREIVLDKAPQGWENANGSSSKQEKSNRMPSFRKYLSFTILGSALAFTAVEGLTADLSLENIPQYPGSTRLCNEHVSGEKMHIQWKSFASGDSVATVTEFFEKRLGAQAVGGEHASRKITPPGNADLILTIYPKQSEGKFPSCAQKPDPSAKTVILISQAIRKP